MLPAFVDVGWLGYSNDRWGFDVGLFGEMSLVSGRLLTRFSSLILSGVR